MRCLLCGEEMRLVRAVRDEAMLVPGFEHHILSCPSCHDEETRLVFIERVASLSPCTGTGEIEAQALDAPLEPAAPASGKNRSALTKHAAPKEITIVQSEKMLSFDSLPRGSAPSLLPKSRTMRSSSSSSSVWGRKAELHRARWRLLCGRLGLRLASRKPDTPTGS
jgi:hypothetical protein